MHSSTAPGHEGRFVFGRFQGQDVAVMQGRLHTYEGYSFEDVSYPVRVLKLLGAETVVLTNAAGGVNTHFRAGDLMLITDQIKLFGVSPLCGPNLAEFGPRFPDVSHIYTPSLQKIVREEAAARSLPLKEGVYMYFPGPQYETPAEVRAARTLGADAVGMAESKVGIGSKFTVFFPDRRVGSSGVSDVPFDYAGGFNRTLLELSDALPYQAFLLKNQD